MSVARPDSPETLEDIKIMGVLSKIANSSNPFGMSYKAAYDYELALSRGDTNLEIFDFSVMSQCILCGKPASKVIQTSLPLAADANPRFRKSTHPKIIMNRC